MRFIPALLWTLAMIVLHQIIALVFFPRGLRIVLTKSKQMAMAAGMTETQYRAALWGQIGFSIVLNTAMMMLFPYFALIVMVIVEVRTLLWLRKLEMKNKPTITATLEGKPLHVEKEVATG